MRFEDTHSINLFVFWSRYNNKVGWWQFSPPPTIVEDLTRRRVYWLTITSSEWSGLTPREVIYKQSTVPELTLCVTYKPSIQLILPEFIELRVGDLNDRQLCNRTPGMAERRISICVFFKMKTANSASVLFLNNIVAYIENILS